MRQKLIEQQGEIDESTTKVGDFLTLLSELDILADRKSARMELNLDNQND